MKTYQRLTTQAAIEHFGGVNELREALGVSRQAINQWGQFVPIGRAFELQIMTGGALVARAEGPQQPAGPGSRKKNAQGGDPGRRR